MRQIIIIALLAALCGCSEITSLMGDKSEIEASVARPAPSAPPQDDSFCRNVAVEDATGKGFDEATQKRVAEQSYLECHARH